jgi:hypothetical protein
VLVAIKYREPVAAADPRFQFLHKEMQMANTTRLSFELTLPEDGPTLSDIDALARRLNITRDAFITRAMIVYAEEVEAQLQDPRVMRQFGSPGGSEQE